MQIDSRLWYEQLLDLVDLLYQANNARAIGDQLFQGLTGLMAFDAAIFTPINWQTLELKDDYYYGSLLASPVYSQSDHPPYDHLFFDPMCLTRLNQAIRLSDILPDIPLPECYQLDKRPSLYHHALGVVASWRRRPIAAIRLYRQKGEPDFSGSEIKLLNRLALHLANAFHFQDSTLTLEPLRENGLIVFGADNRLIFKNEAVNCMLADMPLDSVLSIVKNGGMWLKNGAELYRAEIMPITHNSLLTFFSSANVAGSAKPTPIPKTNGLNNIHPITIISIEPFRRRQAIANRLKFNGLSPREIEVSLGIMRGLSNSNIAKQLFIDEKTVKDHLQRIYAKIQIKTRTELISKMLGLDIELGQHESLRSADFN